MIDDPLFEANIDTSLPVGMSKIPFWYTEFAALFITTVKWAALGIGAGVCVGLGTKLFLTLLGWATSKAHLLDAGLFRYYYVLPLALPACVWLIRTFAPTAKGHGTEAVITAVHTRSGKIDLTVAPVKLLATVMTLAFGGSVGKEGPCAQIGAAITSGFADLLRLSDEDRRRFVICGIGAGFAAVFGTPLSGALFGIEVLYLGRIEYPVLFPCLIAGITAHLVCGVAHPIPVIHGGLGVLTGSKLVALSLLFGLFFGLVSRLLIGTLGSLDRGLHRFRAHPYAVAAVGGLFLAALYSILGDQYAGLGLGTINSALSGTTHIALLVFAVKIVSTAVTLETGGSGGIVTPIFFIGTTLGAALASVLGLPSGAFAAFGFVAVLAASCNTPIAAAVMGMELLPAPLGVYAALCACTAYLIVGHRGVYASQRLGYSKTFGLEVPLGVAIGELSHADLRVRPGTWMARFHHVSSTRKVKAKRRGSPTDV